ncbi:MAG: aminotransferase class V-fold PLP-dependent enzyme [Fimbriimonadaceae bacterium]|nr:aminotransferase class V-fold PLP-dependent enzyme [Fimbriimonadaceae bacterium]QYK56006.1 MAG: aminotransferase class V-fold PLP-dependent enzyme [Fimbriimonadaceae bacterium]
MNRFYLDHAATTPLAAPAREAMARWLGQPANASSLHAEGRAARDAVDQARETVAEAFGCLFGEVAFTSGGTEAANLAILGTALANPDERRRRVLFGAAEHHCVLHTRPILERLGYRVEILPTCPDATVAPESLAAALGEDVFLVSVMQANNEVGSINPIEALAGLAHEAGALFHTDAVQTFPFDEAARPATADLISAASHKTYGPQGAGALYARSGVPLQPLAVGGGQEREVRAGTENVAAIVGFAAAVAWRLAEPGLLAKKRAARDAFAQALLKDGRFQATLLDWQGPGVLCGHFHCRLPGLSAETALIRLDRAGVAASSGAACSSGSLLPSHVLLSMGFSEAAAREGLRFSFGPAQDAAFGEAVAAHVRGSLTG